MAGSYQKNCSKKDRVKNKKDRSKYSLIEGNGQKVILLYCDAPGGFGIFPCLSSLMYNLKRSAPSPGLK